MFFSAQTSDLRPTSIVSLRTFAAIGYAEALRTCKRWRNREVLYEFGGMLPSDLGAGHFNMDALVDDLVNAGATADDGGGAVHDESASTTEREACLKYLMDNNHVQRLENNELAFTEKGLATVRTTWMAGDPVSFFSRRLDVTLLDSTAWELCSYLLDHGWAFKELPKKNRVLHLNADSDGLVVRPDEQHIYLRITASEISRWYLLVLASLDDLHGQGVKEITHGESDKSYKILMGQDIEKRSRKKRKPTSLMVEDMVVLPPLEAPAPTGGAVKAEAPVAPAAPAAAPAAPALEDASSSSTSSRSTSRSSSRHSSNSSTSTNKSGKASDDPAPLPEPASEPEPPLPPAAAEPPPLPPPVAPPPGPRPGPLMPWDRRGSSEEKVYFGDFPFLSFSRGSNYTAWQVTCPFHKDLDDSGTKCTKTMKFVGEENGKKSSVGGHKLYLKNTHIHRITKQTL